MCLLLEPICIFLLLYYAKNNVIIRGRHIFTVTNPYNIIIIIELSTVTNLSPTWIDHFNDRLQ